MVIDRLTFHDIRQVAILDYLWDRGVKTTITSNGLSIHALTDQAVKRFHSVEFSLDFPTEREHDAFRGQGNWRGVMTEIERCADIGLSVTVTSVMMSINYNKLGDLAKVASSLGANLRVNVYQPAKTDQFTLTYDQFWQGFKRLLGSARLVATTEPVLAAVLGLKEFAGPACGRTTVRVAPDGRILPCTYWPNSRLTLADLATLGEQIVQAPDFLEARHLPAACDGCPCQGGCAGRRALVGGLHESDPYCPFVRKDKIIIDWEQVTGQELPKVGSACTTVVSAR
jgi:radical SAM protein with 4Fe4S-binding SPASM domain